MEERGNILLVDDEKSIRVIFRRILEGAGYQVHTAKDIDACKEWLGTKTFDAVLMDIIMPGPSGIDGMEYIRRFDEDLPVILITGDPSLETAMKAVKEGAYDYLAKPVGKQELLSVVKRALDLRRLRHEMHELERKNEEYRISLEDLVEKRSKELQLRNDAFAEFSTIYRTLEEDQEGTDIFQLVADSSPRIVGASSCGVFLLTEGGKRLTVKAHRNLSKETLQELEGLPSGEGLPWFVMENREVLNLPNVPQATIPRSSTRDTLLKEGVIAAIGTPIRLGKEIFGAIITTTSDPGKVPLAHEDILANLGTLLALYMSRTAEKWHTMG